LSVELYVSKDKARYEAEIQKNLEYVKLHPYPLEDLKKAITAAGEKSELSLAFNENGRAPGYINLSAQVRAKAKEQTEEYPNLWQALNDGHTGLRKLETNKKYLEYTSDPKKIEDKLRTDFSAFLKGLQKLKSTGAEIDGKVIFSDATDEATFYDYLDECRIDFDDTLGKELKAAFNALYAEYSAQIKDTPEESAKESSPINETAEEAASGETSSPINDNGALKKEETPSSPINNEAAKQAETTETTDTAQATVATKPAELKTEEASPQPAESKDININLESTAPATDTKAGEIFSSSSSSAINANTDNSTTANSETTATSVTNSAINMAESKPAAASNNKRSVFKSVVNNLKDSALQSLGMTGSSGIGSAFTKYLGVGAGKLGNIVKPAINTFNTIKDTINESKASQTDVTTSTSALNAPVTSNSSTAAGDVNNQTSTSQTMVESKSPAIPNDVKLATQSTTNNSSLIEKSSSQAAPPANSATYSESTQIGAPSKTEKTENQSSQVIQQSSPSNINISELVNEMRAIKLLLMGGIDVNNK
jgi:hypothetical protein